MFGRVKNWRASIIDAWPVWPPLQIHAEATENQLVHMNGILTLHQLHYFLFSGSVSVFEYDACTRYFSVMLVFHGQNTNGLYSRVWVDHFFYFSWRYLHDREMEWRRQNRINTGLESGTIHFLRVAWAVTLQIPSPAFIFVVFMIAHGDL